jgi:hypothetical protein
MHDADAIQLKFVTRTSSFFFKFNDNNEKNNASVHEFTHIQYLALNNSHNFFSKSITLWPCKNFPDKKILLNILLFFFFKK